MHVNKVGWSVSHVFTTKKVLREKNKTKPRILNWKNSVGKWEDVSLAAPHGRTHRRRTEARGAAQVWSNCKTGTIQKAVASFSAVSDRHRRARRAEEKRRTFTTFIALCFVETGHWIGAAVSPEMSFTGSQTRLHQIGRRSSSRPDLTAAGFSLPRNDGAPFFMSGNGYHSDFNDGYVQTTTHTFSKNSLGGGGGGGGGMQGWVSINKWSSCALFINKVWNKKSNSNISYQSYTVQSRSFYISTFTISQQLFILHFARWWNIW